MKFLWPSALFLLGLLPLLALFYLWMQRRKRRYVVRYSSLSLVREALPAQSSVRRYLPPALFLLALAGLVFGLARPVAAVSVPSGSATIMLTIDVSGSMRQNDISPSRLAAAKNAALTFIERQENNNRIGIVAFAGFAQLVQPPSTDSEELELAIQNLTTGRGTAIGSGILTALDTISEFNENVLPSSSGDESEPQGSPAAQADFVPDIIVVLTDGVYTTGPHPVDAAQLAAERGVRVYTIGFGTARGMGDPFNEQFGGRGFNRGIDEATLQEIAAVTGAEYYTATTAEELQKVFANLPTYLATREETMEISFLFAAAGALLVISAVLLSQLWHPLP